MMGEKIFVSYKYNDSDVASLNGKRNTTVRDYVDEMENKFKSLGKIYKGEHSDEDLSDRSEDYIWEHLKDKIFDSSITIVLISPNMKEPNRQEKSQWIPWEISYSLRETERGGYKSRRNAMLAVKLPNRERSYAYCKDNDLFHILSTNIADGYIYKVTWHEFCKKPNVCIERAKVCKLLHGEPRVDVTKNSND